MKKYVIGLLLAMLMGVGFTLELPNGSTIIVTDDAGVVVGFGEFDDGTLELDISADATGFLTLTFTTEDGEIVSVEVMVSGEEVVVVDTLMELGDEVVSSGGTSDIAFVSSSEIAAGVAQEHIAAALAQRDAALGEAEANSAEGEAHANGNAGEGAANADQGSENAGDVPSSEEAGAVEVEDTEADDASDEAGGDAATNADAADGFVPTAPGAP